MIDAIFSVIGFVGVIYFLYLFFASDEFTFKVVIDGEPTIDMHKTKEEDSDDEEDSD